MAGCPKGSWKPRLRSVVLGAAQLVWLSALISELVNQKEVAAWTYNYSTKAYSWNNSRAFCKRHFTDLVAIQNKNEIAHLNDVIPYVNSYYWIGIRKINNKWTWVGTNKTLTAEAENWADNEPNNKRNNQDCVEIYIKSNSAPGKWNDEPCFKRKRALCYTASCQDMSCNSQGECIETIGSYTCSCYPGFYGPECEYVQECGKFDIPQHVLMNCSHPLGDFSFSSQCTFSCPEGYDLNGPSEMQCLASGIWTNNPPQCKAVQCQSLEAPLHGTMDCTHPLAAFAYDSSCKFECQPGYRMRGSDILHCTDSGQWSEPLPTCEAIACEPLESPLHGSMDCFPSTGAFGYNSSCTFRCTEGFVLMGNDAIHCADLGQWTAPAPVCEAVSCTPLLSPENGTMTCIQPLGHSNYKSTCQFMCDEGFYLSGPERLDCSPSGHWTGSPPMCEAIKCPEIFAPEQGSLDCSHVHGEFSVGSTCHFSCNEEFELLGSRNVECTVSGRWSAPPPTCKGVTSLPVPSVRCPALTTPGQGTMSCRHHLESFGPNTTCYFGCKTGFTLRGANSLRCGASGQWTAVTPVCRAVKCSELHMDTAVAMNCSNPWGNFSYGSTCAFHCPEGQSLNGSARTTCREDGHWSDAMPTCQAGTLTIQEALTYLGGALASTTGLAVGGTLLALLRKRLRKKDDGKCPLNPHSHLGTYGVFTNAAYDPTP
uniref:p-selectin n=1 Tax=Rattus norvegicus TaxID=10116 RepID=A0ABK0L6N3_RAT